MATSSIEACALPQGLRYYILRESTHSMVPLVPVDQLPFLLKGVPPLLNHRQLSEGGWVFIGEGQEPESVLRISGPAESISDSSMSSNSSEYRSTAQKNLPWSESLHLEDRMQPRIFNSPDHTRRHRPVSNGSTDTSLVDSGPGNIRPSSTPQADPNDGIRTLIDGFATIYHQDAHRLGYHKLPPSGIEPDPSKKEFCTYWIKTGECAFLSTGCRYKHEMPPLDKLKLLGFSSVPRWFREETAIVARAPTWMERRIKEGNQEVALRHSSKAVSPDSKSNTRETQSQQPLGREQLRVREIPTQVDPGHECKLVHISKENYSTPVSSPLPTHRVPDLLIDIAAEPDVQPSLSAKETTRALSPQRPKSEWSKGKTLSPTAPKSVEKSSLDASIVRKLPQARQLYSWASEDDDSDADSLKPVKLPARKCFSQRKSKVSVDLQQSGLLKSQHATGKPWKSNNRRPHQEKPKKVSMPTLCAR